MIFFLFILFGFILIRQSQVNANFQLKKKKLFSFLLHGGTCGSFNKVQGLNHPWQPHNIPDCLIVLFMHGCIKFLSFLRGRFHGTTTQHVASHKQNNTTQRTVSQQAQRSLLSYFFFCQPLNL